MDWLSEFQTKYGFDDGESVPVNVEEVRDVYIAFINHFAAKWGSAYRAHGYDSGGMHNPCWICFTPQINPEDFDVDTDTALEDTDEAFQRAVERAEWLDNYVWITANVDPNWKSLLEDDDDEA